MSLKWKTASLGELLAADFDGTWGDASTGEDGIRVIRSTEMRGNSISYHSAAVRFVTRKGLANKRLLPGDILVNKASGSSHLVGKSVLFMPPDESDYLCSNFVRCLRPNSSLIDCKYLYYATQSPDFRAQVFGAQRTTSGLRNLKISEYKEASILFPESMDEQRSIVQKIEDCTQRIDEVEKLRIETNKEKNALLESFIEAEFQSASGNEVVLEEVCGITSELVDPRKPSFINSIHVGGANIESETGRLIDLKTSHEEKLKSAKFPFDSSMVLFNKIRPYLKKVARPDLSGICSADMYPLSPDPTKLDKDYLFFLLLSRNFTRYAIEGSNRAGMPKVNRKHLFAYRFNLPPLDQQQQIAERLNEALTTLEIMRAEYLAMQSDEHRFRDAILRKAFAGEL